MRATLMKLRGKTFPFSLTSGITMRFSFGSAFQVGWFKYVSVSWVREQ